MKYLLLIAGLLLAGRSWGQSTLDPYANPLPTDGEAFVGVWKIKARCVETYCNAPGEQEARTNTLTAQTWTISQSGAGNNSYTLTSDTKAVSTLKNGRIVGETMVFQGCNCNYGSTDYGHRIVLKLVGNKLQGTQMSGREDGYPVCFWRYSLSGAQ